MGLNQNICEKFELNRNLCRIPFQMMYKMSMLRHRFSDEQFVCVCVCGGGGGGALWVTFLSYSVKVCYMKSTCRIFIHTFAA